MPTLWFARWRRRCYRICAGSNDAAVLFEKTVAFLVLLNVLSMAVTWYRQPHWVDVFTETVDNVFTLAFMFEMYIKLMGLGPRQYVADAHRAIRARTSHAVDRAKIFARRS